MGTLISYGFAVLLRGSVNRGVAEGAEVLQAISSYLAHHSIIQKPYPERETYLCITPSN